MQLFKRSISVFLALGVSFALISACSDTSTSPERAAPSDVSQLKPKRFAVCVYGQWQGDGTCSGSVEYCSDNTFASGAFCADVSLCGDFGCDGGGSYGGGYGPPPNSLDTYDPDPSGLCNDLNSESSVLPDSSAASCNLGDFLPMVVYGKPLWGCPVAAAGNMVYLGTTFFPQGVIAYTLTRGSEIRNKSWGGIPRFGVAYYTGTVQLNFSPPVQVKGEVLCYADPVKLQGRGTLERKGP